MPWAGALQRHPLLAQGNVSDVPLYRECRNRYQVPAAPGQASTPGCHCGLDSIGACTQCGRRLCGDHIMRHAGRVLCADHSAAAARADAKAHEAREAKARAAMREQMARWEREAAAALGALPDPVDRGVRLLATALPRVYGPELASVRDAARKLTVSDIAAWFLRSVTTAPEQVGVYEPHWLTTRPRYRERPGWSFPSSATVARPHGETGPGSITVVTDGRVFFDRQEEPQPGVDFSGEGLREMLRLLSLPPLGAPSRPYRSEEYEVATSWGGTYIDQAASVRDLYKPVTIP